MSVQTLPRWQRAFLRWFLERKIRKGNRSLHCPECQGLMPLPHRLNDALWDMLIVCPHCGHQAPLMEFAFDHNKTPEERLAEGRLATTPPVSTRITVENYGSVRKWTVPARGGCNTMLGFAAFWLLLSTVAFIAVLSGGTEGSPDIGAVVFISIFEAIGVGMLYAGLRMSYAHHVLTVDSVEVIHERRMFGRAKRKALPRGDVSRVELVVFYSENYKPVHGIEIEAGGRKIKFGSALTPQEKAWLCEDLRVALLQQATASTPRRAAAPLQDASSVLGPVPNSRIAIEQRARGTVVHIAPGKTGKHIMIIGSVFVTIATFMIVMGARMWMPPSGGAPLPFMLVWNGFCLFWCGGVASFGAFGLGIAISGWRMNRTHHKITATAEALQVIETCGSSQHETLVPTSQVQDIRTSVFATIESNSSNEKGTKEVKHRGIIIFQDRAIGFGGGCSLSELHAAIAALKNAMGRE